MIRRFSVLEKPGDVMTIGLTILCIGAVTFLLRVLVALVKEWMSFSRNEEGVDFEKFTPSRPRGKLIEMSSEVRTQTNHPRTGERMAF